MDVYCVFWILDPGLDLNLDLDFGFCGTKNGCVSGADGAEVMKWITF